MPRMRGTKDFKQTLKEVSVEAIQVGARWLAASMRQLVAKQCGVVGARSKLAKEKRHSFPGEPPRMESGEGLSSIGWEATKTGARVGVRSIGTRNMIGQNYMAGWDSPKGIRDMGRRPWLSRFFTEPNRYQKEMSRIMLRAMKAQTGAR
jgi:hypothetical protein